MTDVNNSEYVRVQTKILAELADVETNGIHTKKEYIIKLKDVTRPLIVSGYYPDATLNDFCSLIGELLKKHNVEYSSGHLAELFDDDEKRTQHNPKHNSPDGGVETVPPSEENPGSIEDILDHLEKKIGKSYDTMPDYEAADKLQTLENIANKSVSHVKTFTRKLMQAHYFVDCFEKQFENQKACEQVMSGLPKKQRERLFELSMQYDASVLLISEMESELINTSDNEIKELQAVQAMTSRDIDERNKLSNWNKSMIVLAMKAAGIAKNQCAKLCGIDKKHITNNIYPKESPTETHTKNRHHDYISYFDNITIELDGKSHTFNISRWYDEQIERKKLSLEFKPLVVATASVK